MSLLLELFAILLFASSPSADNCRFREFDPKSSRDRFEINDIQNNKAAITPAREKLLEQLDLRAMARPSYKKAEWAKTSNAVAIVVTELLTSAVMHGGKVSPGDGIRDGELDPTKTVSMAVSVSETGFEITIRDQGAGYNPWKIADPTLIENLELDRGRGLHLALAFSNWLDYTFDHGSVHTVHFGWTSQADTRDFQELRKAKLVTHSLPPGEVKP